MCYDIEMKIEIIKMKRRTMVLKVESAEKAVLKVPVRVSDRKIVEFLQSKQKWLSRIEEKFKEVDQLSNKFEFDKFIYLNGEQEMSVNQLFMDFDKQNKEKRYKIIKKYYLSLFETLSNLVYKISAETGLKFISVKPTDSVRIWGSYNSKGEMKLNWKLLILPERLVRYVICHELCHSLHLNHKPQFWVDVNKICPNYKALKKELTSYGFVLKNWRES